MTTFDERLNALALALSAIRLACHLLDAIALAPSTSTLVSELARQARLDYPSIDDIRAGLPGSAEQWRRWRAALLDTRSLLEHYQLEGQDANLQWLAIRVMRTFPRPEALRASGECLELTVQGQDLDACDPGHPGDHEILPTTPGDRMTTMEQTRIALKAGRRLLQQLNDAATPAPNVEALKLGVQASWDLGDYPSDAAVDTGLAALEGYGLMLAVRRIECVRRLIDELAADTHSAWAKDARWLGRHFPEREDLAAVRSPKAARAWAAFHLGRPPRRMAVVCGSHPPAPSARARQRPRVRREALRQLRSALQRLDRDEHFPPLGVSEARQVLSRFPTNSELGQRFSGLDGERLDEVFDALQRGCQLIEAVVDGTLPASLRSQALAQGLSRGLPYSEDFAVTTLSPQTQQAWLDWLFARAPRHRFGRSVTHQRASHD